MISPISSHLSLSLLSHKNTKLSHPYLPKIDCLPLQTSLSYLGGPYYTPLSTFPRLRVNQWVESQLPSHLHTDLLLTPARPPPSTPPISIHDGLQGHLQTGSITASKCISEFTLSGPPSASPNSLDHGLQVHLWVTRSRPPSASPNSLDYGLQVHLWVQLDLGLQVHLHTHLITASKCISEFTLSWPASASPNSTDHGLQVRTIMSSQCIS